MNFACVYQEGLNFEGKSGKVLTFVVNIIKRRGYKKNWRDWNKTGDT